MVAIRPFPSARTATVLLLSALLSVSSSWAASTRDETTINCKELLKLSDKLSFDLSSLDAEREVSQTRSTPPSTMVDSLRFNVCGDLKPIDGVKAEDQVSTYTAM
jgi:hypothetical protein